MEYSCVAAYPHIPSIQGTCAHVATPTEWCVATGWLRTTPLSVVVLRYPEDDDVVHRDHDI